MASELHSQLQGDVSPVETLGDRHLAFWASHLASPSFVYVIQGDQGGPIKVGVAKDVRGRMLVLQTGNPYRLRLLYVMPGAHDLEWQFHQKLKAGRTYGEWFDGPLVEGFFCFVADLAERMVDAYDGSGEAPSFRDFGSWRRQPSAEKLITVKFVEPDPVPEDVAVKGLRAGWMSPRRLGESLSKER